MEKPVTVVIADQSVQLCRELRAALEETGAFEVVAITNEGGKATELVDRLSPDVFIIDLMIPMEGVMYILRDIMPQKPRMCVIAISFFATEYMEYSLIELGVCHLQYKPFDMHHAGPYIQKLWREHRRKIRSITYHSAQHLRALGIPADVLGYPYLQKAIELAVNNSTAAANITRDIYVPIASFFHTTPDQVRCEISRAVKLALKCGDSELLQSFYKYRPSNKTGVATNGEFIATIAERIRLIVTE